MLFLIQMSPLFANKNAKEKRKIYKEKNKRMEKILLMILNTKLFVDAQ